MFRQLEILAVHYLIFGLLNESLFH